MSRASRVGRQRCGRSRGNVRLVGSLWRNVRTMRAVLVTDLLDELRR